MSVIDATSIDGIAISQNDALVLLISDEMSWGLEDNHLILLQRKINAYLKFCESKQYEKVYPGRLFDSAIFEFRFAYAPTDNAMRFLSVVQTKLAEEGISIVVYID